MRRLVPAVAALAIVAGLYGISTASAGRPDPEPVSAQGYAFERLPIAMPPGYEALPHQEVRAVNPAYERIRSWISSVGAGVAINDLAGSGRDDGMCLVDPRTDSVVVTYTPTAPAGDRFTPFTLDPAPLPLPDSAAPMGCVPGDYNADGRIDLLVYYWGRTPVLQLGRPGPDRPSALSASHFAPAELLSSSVAQDTYAGEPWNTNAVLVDDLSGDGHPDVVVGNYFPQSGVLDPHGRQDVTMNDSLSHAENGGGTRVLRWVRNDAAGRPVYVEDKDAVPFRQATGWVLGLGAADLDGDQLPEVYVANDFGHDHLLHNVSTTDRIAFEVATGSRGPATPKSFALGRGSFKGMGVDFADLSARGRFDMVVSNITTAWGLEESNFVWRNDAADEAAMARALEEGRAPFTQVAEEVGMAWTGWSWDVKAADFRNTGTPDVVQTDGFVKGDVNRWAWLQELATSNDVLVRQPGMWPRFEPGADVAGHQELAFYAPDGSGRYANITKQVGTDIPTPSRGVAVGDTTGTGTLDFAVAYQWADPVFYRNTSTDVGAALELRLVRPVGGGSGSGATTPAYGATVRVRTQDGTTRVGRLDGGSGHAGKRAFPVHVGLGDEAGPVMATVSWRELDGTPHTEDVTLTLGNHTLVLTDTMKETTR
ncbi:ASPIC/UnbV domain-containing protein [Phycicoccus flavus]|uniref:ASPIC/UnbV domain-containing protein n=1 Tax=Phycicoccus flavus TaxID=2502783 RepID=UPI000FEBB94D|nr:ASPIC/UnbV domain-containing protein [Phycicoccus flavus]NHA69046.1 RNA-binding protein [Phycicoccus flavus]